MGVGFSAGAVLGKNMVGSGGKKGQFFASIGNAFGRYILKSMLISTFCPESCKDNIVLHAIVLRFHGTHIWTIKQQ